MPRSTRKGVLAIGLAALVLTLLWWLGPRDHDALDVEAPSAPASVAPEESHANEPATEPTPAALPEPPREEASTAPAAAQSALDELELAGTVLDRGTGEPLFGFELSAWIEGMPRGSSRSAQTDEQGRFSFGPLQAEGVVPSSILLTLVDHPSIRRRSSDNRLRWKRELPDGRFPLPARLEVAVGPTVAFELAYPPELGAWDFQASLRPGPPVLESGVFDPTLTALRTPLGFGPHPHRPWVRFGEPTRIRDRAWIELRSHDGLWRGGAWITQLAGVLPEPVSIVFEGTTRLVGRFSLPSSDEERGVALRLSEIVDGALAGSPIRAAADFAGEFEFKFLRPGRYRLWTQDAAWQPFTLEFDLHSGENDLGVHALFPRPVVGKLAGVVRSVSGRFDGACHISLADILGVHDAPFDSSLTFEPLNAEDEDGELVARFEFEDVTAGEWWLYVHCHDGFEFPGSAVRVQAPNEDLQLLLQDRALRVRFELVEAESGAPCPAAQLEWSCGEASGVESGAEVELDQSLPDAPERLRWVSVAPDRKLAHGSGLDFERREGVKGRVELVGRIELEPGFGRRIVARRRGVETPLPGVEVRCDGQLVGVTGPDGVLDVLRDAAPTRITLAKEGWIHVSSNDLDANSGRFGEGPVLLAVLEPERP